MNKLINQNNLKCFAYENGELINGNILGITINFYGLGCQNMNKSHTDIGKFFAGNNILFVEPYLNPWSWMNKQAILVTDEIIQVIKDKYNIKNTPIVSSGNSMGGQQALIYSLYSKNNIIACITNCPVCDLVFHYSERDDLPRTLYSALFWEDGDINSALAKYSPLHQVLNMPKIKYVIYHCDKDTAVNINSHSKLFVKQMKENGFDITLNIVKDREHCNLDEDSRNNYNNDIILSITKGSSF